MAWINCHYNEGKARNEEIKVFFSYKVGHLPVCFEKVLVPKGLPESWPAKGMNRAAND